MAHPIVPIMMIVASFLFVLIITPRPNIHHKGPKIGIPISVYCNSKESQLKNEAQKALDAIGSKHTLSVSYKRANRDQHVFNNGLLKLHSNVLKDLRTVVGDWGRGEQLQLDLNPLDQDKRKKIGTTMVAHFSENENYVDYNADLYGHFVKELQKALVAYLKAIIFNNEDDQNQMRERVQLIADAMVNYDVYVDPMARDRWLQKNRGREQQYNDVREALRVMFQNILQDFKKVISVYRPDINSSELK